MIALVNNLDQDISYQLGNNNNATVSENLVPGVANASIDFNLPTYYDMANYTLFAPPGQVSTEVKILPARRTLLLMGANSALNTTVPQQYQISYSLAETNAMALIVSLTMALYTVVMISL